MRDYPQMRPIVTKIGYYIYGPHPTILAYLSNQEFDAEELIDVDVPVEWVVTIKNRLVERFRSINRVLGKT